MKRITIVGGGASGTLLAVNLLKNAGDAPIEVNLVERKTKVGRGVAFGTTRDAHLLNVPAGRMGAFPDEVGDFHRWLTDKGHTFEPNDFVPRKIYGEYLREVFTNATVSAGSNARFNLIDDEAVDMSVNDDSAEVMLGSGEVLPSSKVVLAFGNFKPPHPNVPNLDFTESERYFQNPWDSTLYKNIFADDTIFIVGTGLSMVDVVLHFQKSGHRGKIYAISTRGLLPAVHKLGFTYPSFYDEIKDMDRITDMLKAVRRHIALAEADSSDWRAVIDSLRPMTQQLWLDLSLAEKRYFMQHLSRYWNVARHRMPGEAAAVLLDMCEQGSLEVVKGLLRGIHLTQNNRFEIAFSNIDDEQRISADALVNCIGSESDLTKIDSQFVRNLVERGHIRNDELSLGIAASPDGGVVDRTGKISPIVHTLGTALRGTLWETTAIPEIRTQARDLALKLLAD